MALPCPGFEGSEKRLEVDFCFGSGSPPSGLRTLSRRQLDGLLEKVPARLTQAGADGDMSESILCAFLHSTLVAVWSRARLRRLAFGYCSCLADAYFLRHLV